MRLHCNCLRFPQHHSHGLVATSLSSLLFTPTSGRLPTLRVSLHAPSACHCFGHNLIHQGIAADATHLQDTILPLAGPENLNDILPAATSFDQPAAHPQHQSLPIQPALVQATFSGPVSSLPGLTQGDDDEADAAEGSDVEMEASRSDRSASSRDANDEDFVMSPSTSRHRQQSQDDDEDEESDPVVRPGRGRKSAKHPNKRAKLDFGDDLDPELYGLRRSVRHATFLLWFLTSIAGSCWHVIRKG